MSVFDDARAREAALRSKSLEQEQGHQRKREALDRCLSAWKLNLDYAVQQLKNESLDVHDSDLGLECKALELTVRRFHNQRALGGIMRHIKMEKSLFGLWTNLRLHGEFVYVAVNPSEASLDDNFFIPCLIKNRFGFSFLKIERDTSHDHTWNFISEFLKNGAQRRDFGFSLFAQQYYSRFNDDGETRHYLF